MDYGKITDNFEVVKLLIQRTRIEKEIMRLDDKALVKYELEKLAETQANDAERSSDKCHIHIVSNNEVAVNCATCKHVNRTDGAAPCNACNNFDKWKAIN